MHLQVDYIGASMAGDNRHAQHIMSDLGITYQKSTPQSINDTFWFWNCHNIPKSMPNYVKKLNVKAMDCIGYGLDEATAIAITENENK